LSAPQHVVGHALERLAERDPAVGAARPEVDVRQPALAPPAAPLRREHDEIEAVHLLDLEPLRAAAAGVVRRIERLGHHALVTARDRILVERRRLLGARRDHARDRERRCERAENGPALLRGAREQRLVVDQQRVERGQRQRQLGRERVAVLAEPLHRVLKRQRAPVRL
jgi:hypothetical protein